MNKNTYYKKQLLTLIIVALALQGIISMLGVWGLYPIQKMFLWAVRLFLLIELIYGIMNFSKGDNKPLPFIGKYGEKAF
ncbi:MAG: hypothetical protein A2741_01970 [Candidatus Zambryskibacteria bacterium RIFCSPHIGHO2_01_FULL_43_27]|uniref:Uncharacterized protein n=1 Tax=Candidatus Zambryskibacteria bacterium RIFCSPLOWO2_01_FULL_43_17 TaxID=1802760 RepID=A0A1G2U109_9BACT|nr:MAG: hypothetical protein A2741_01970 [Candidatus Zambryskibacteria bacterium RIFCSPHIGHO2_01_FULL_43_27]OHA99790.1 MAG: hypothetical protein A3E93_00965 [Candidatus Zambryskibacteria bacterium RIFCSPHIGHO2_12_FULL_43_12b]OHB03205.1 MAG: hypothetical protein A2920_02455 [Candidatus Zambryskibacteria bacterium RIFCSPLOWO2_01_FULL_43_17]